MADFYGHERVAYFNPEATFDTVATPETGDALRTTAASFGVPHGTAIPNDRTGTLDDMERIVARQPEQPWSLSGIFRPSGSLGVAPDIGNILAHTQGLETVVASTSVAYTLVEDKTNLSATIMTINGDDILQGVSGAIVQNFSMTWDGEAFITWSADGVAASYIEAGVNETDGSGAASSNLVVNDGSYYTVGGIIKIGSDDNSGAGHRITAVSGENITIASTATWSDAEAVVPFLPAGTFAGDPLFGTDGSVSFDNGSTTMETESGTLQIATGLGLINSSFGQTKPQRPKLMAKRNNTFSLVMLAGTGNSYLMQDFRANTSYDMQIILGDTATKRMKANMDNSFFNPEARPSAEADVIEWTVNGKAFGSSGEDSLDLFLD